VNGQQPAHPDELARLREENDRLQRVNAALIGRIERVMDESGDAYAIFEKNIAMQTAIRERTEALAAANERLTAEVGERRRAEAEMRRARDEAEAASRAKSDFLANMSHEIRTPMTAVLGYADLLVSESGIARDPAQAGEIIRLIKSNADHLLRVINDVLDVSKIEAGRITIERVPISPMQAAEEVASMLRPIAIDKGLELRVAHKTDLPERILSDPTRLRQILLNLVGNAIKFTGSGRVDITTAFDTKAQQLRFAVRDTGIGMSPEQLDVVRRFAPFTQADASMTRRFGGTGLGLRISNSLAELMDGMIEIDSEPNNGSVFTLSIATGPLEGVRLINADRPRDMSSTDHHRSNRDKPEAEPSQAKPLAGVRVLLAEDGVDNRRLITFHLTKAGAAVVCAANGRIAVEYVLDDESDTPPDLILMDMQMPEMDGYAATRAIRSAGVTLPIIAITAHAMEGDREKCLAAGCSDYTTKPIDRVALVNMCKAWLDQSDRAKRAAIDAA
jgi:signal transduction histidine kinase/CheY-like chemotaxis protein